MGSNSGADDPSWRKESVQSIHKRRRRIAQISPNMLLLSSTSKLRRPQASVASRRCPRTCARASLWDRPRSWPSPVRRIAGRARQNIALSTEPKPPRAVLRPRDSKTSRCVQSPASIRFRIPSALHAFSVHSRARRNTSHRQVRAQSQYPGPPGGPPSAAKSLSRGSINFTGRTFTYSPSPCADPAVRLRPLPDRQRSHFGPPTAPKKLRPPCGKRPASRQEAGVPAASIAAPPIEIPQTQNW